MNFDKHEWATRGTHTQTNADHIRSMTDEELAEDRVFQQTFIDGEIYWRVDFNGYERTERAAIKKELDWLKQPYEEG